MTQHRRSTVSAKADWDEGWWEAERDQSRPVGSGLLVLIAGLALTAAALWWLGGPPRMLEARPDLAALRRLPDFLRSSPEPAEFRPVLPWALAVGWLLWSWLVLSILLQLGVAALELLTRGAAWVRSLRQLVDVATATIARRVVTGATAGYLLVRVLAATSPAAHAAPLPERAQTLVLADPTDPHAAGAAAADRGWATPGTVDYVIQPGDSLWRIAEHFYGDGEQYPRLLAANQGRLQSNGVPFHGLLHPGEVLLVPTEGLVDPGGSRDHIVRPGDTLRAIAADELGDESRWPELLIGGVPARQALADPDRIHPGLRVTVPGKPAAPAPSLTLSDGALESQGGAPATIAVVAAPDGTPLTVTAVTQGVHGTVALAAGGSIVYTPAGGYVGSDAFTFTASDARGRSATATVRVTVTPAAPAPARPAIAGPVPGAAIAGRLAVPAPALPATLPPAGGAVPAVPAPAALPSAPIATPTAPRVTRAPVGPPAAREAGREADPGGMALGAGVAGLALVAGGAVLLRRRRRAVAGPEVVRRMRRAPKPAWQIDPEDYPTDFERTELTHAFQHRLAGGEPEPAAVIATHAATFLRERGLVDSVVLLASHERQSGIVTVRTTPGERRRVMALAAELGGRLGGQGRGERQGNDVELRLAGPTARGLLGPSPGPQPTMIAVAALPNGARLFGNFDALGHILIVGAPGEGADTVLTSLVAELAARRAPDELHLHALASRRALPSDLLAMPHWDGARVDPADAVAVARLLGRLQRALDERRRFAHAPADPDAPPVGWPELVLVIGELAGIDDRGLTTLAQIGRDGPEYGLRLLAATTRSAAVGADLLAHFATRLVLRLADDAQSVRLVGSPDATALGGGGRLLLRLAGEPPRPFAGFEAGALRGLRIGTEDLAALAQGMIVHYGAPTGAAALGAPVDEAVGAVIDVAPEPVADAAVPPAAADEYAAAELVRPTEEAAISLTPEEPSGAFAREPREVPSAVRTEDGIEQAVDNQPRPPASAPASDVSWWDDGAFAADEGEPIGVPWASATETACGPDGASAPFAAAALDELAVSSTALAPAAPLAVGRNGQLNGRVTRCAHHGMRAGGSPEEGNSGGDHEATSSATGGPDGLERSGAPELVAVAARDGAQTAEGPVGVAASLPPPGRAPLDAAEVVPADALPLERADVDDWDAQTDSPGTVADRSDTETGILEITCFGPQLRLHYDRRRITLASPKALELLAFFAVQPPGPIDREMVLHLVWPDRRKGDADDEEEGWGDDEAKSKRLRTTMWRLNKELARQGVALPTPPLRAERDGTVALDTTVARSDVHRFFALCDHATDRKTPPPLEGEAGVVAACREVLALMTAGGTGERRLLSGTGYGWLDEYWRGVKVEDRLRARLRHACERVIDRCLAERRYETALELLQPLFEEDYTDQAVARQLLTAYGHLGDRTSVLYVERMLRQALKRTLFDGLTAAERAAVTEEAYAPARETRLLIARLLGELSPAAGPVADRRSAGGGPVAIAADGSADRVAHGAALRHEKRGQVTSNALPDGNRR